MSTPSDRCRAAWFVSSVLAMAVVAAVAPRPAAACGPDFPVSLLLDRADTLGTLPEGVFVTEVRYLLAPAAPSGPVTGDAEASPSPTPFDLGEEALLHLRRGDATRAVQLYARQAALGDHSGALSLLLVVRELIADRREAEILADPVGQRLLATYLATRSLELADDERERLWDALVAIDRLAGADQLAAVAYQRGDWARAGALLAHADASPVARWVGAKLALRAGDTAAADRLLAGAADGYRARDCPGPVDRLVGERAALALAEDRVPEALALAWEVRATHPDDLVYVAERVATIDELVAFVDKLGVDPWAAADHDAWAVSETSLAALLGRRLMRAGRHDEALAYLGGGVRAPAVAFAQAMLGARQAHDPIDRARALYAASQLARRWGLELLGTAHAPDWELYGGSYDRLAGEDRGPIAGRGVPELVRALASAPGHGQRFHYRHLAADLAEQAAELLPRRSQAFAATLCAAAHYVQHDDRARVERLWRRYVRQGPSVSMDFPGHCPAPVFERARRYLPRPTLARRVWARATAPRALLLGGVLVGGLGLLGVAILRRRRWRRFAARP